jgi:uncharacterized DUF497 family protein
MFSDPVALVEQDRIEGGERRWQTLGIVGSMLLLLVAHTGGIRRNEVDETVGIISARRANRSERQRYEEKRQENNS